MSRRSFQNTAWLAIERSKTPMHIGGLSLFRLLNILLLSYADSLDVSLVACRRTLPHMQRLTDYLEDALVELERIAAPRPQHRRPKPSSRRVA
jgi:hypothetical protein